VIILLQNNDKAVVDINHIGVHEENVAGFFGAYHYLSELSGLHE
jgi:hypothetical protein